ncbi:conjugal transfer protein [Sodalis endosymbiont of Spalangia cameroni]|uniref:conjugal transfer protein n=1 Tax=Sodalis praecaptivus TaxID=1239307 RepID=UPI0031F9AE90
MHNTPVTPAVGYALPAQFSLMPLSLDISGEENAPSPQPASGQYCVCCGYRAHKLWQRRTCDTVQPVCTLCYLTTHLDSPTAAHARLAWLPGLTRVSALHLQRQALLAVLTGEKAQRRDGRRLWRWMVCHARDVERAWGTARAGEFAAALARLPPSRRPRLQHRLDGCVPLFPPAVFDDLTLLLPAGKTAAQALTSWSFPRYCRSDLYVEPYPLD